MAPVNAVNDQSTEINGRVWLAIIGLALVVFLPPCIGFGWTDRRFSQQEREIAALRAELAEQKKELAHVKWLAEIELRRVRPDNPILPRRTSELPVKDIKP